MGLLVIGLHEAAHIAAAYGTGLSVRRIGLSWKGVYIVRETGAPVANMMTTLAGPTANVLAAIALRAYPEFALMNLTFGLMNMLPIPGSDGMRAVTQVTRGSGRRIA
jgi:Zn-dependent protease